MTIAEFHNLLKKHPDFKLTGNPIYAHDFRHVRTDIGICSANAQYSMWWLAECALMDFDMTDQVVGDNYSMLI